jgi:hypothetical protein
MDPCSATEPLGALVAVTSSSLGTPDAIDLSKGTAQVVLDVFDEDPSEQLTLTASAEIGDENVLEDFQLLAKPYSVRDGDTATLDVTLQFRPFDAARVMTASVKNAIFTLCGGPPLNHCTVTRVPISGLPAVPTTFEGGLGASGDAGDAD